jgi:hypothetical protein
MRLMAVEACLIEDRPARGGTVHQANATAGRRAGRQARQAAGTGLSEHQVTGLGSVT